MSRQIRLVTLAPGHFHAALVQKEMHPRVHPRVFVYAPLDDDLLAHLARIHSFNVRSTNPTHWQLDIRAGSEFLARFGREPVGNTAIIAGRNRPKIDRILTAAAAGLHVLADKPWIVEHDDFPKLEQVFREAEMRDLVVWDMMTERFEVASQIQRELVRDPDVFGNLTAGTPDQPALTLESTHYLYKTVAGQPLVRPEWWFDANEAGLALADVGTHLVDMAMWMLFPERPFDYQRDIAVLDAACWPTLLSAEQYAAVTGRTGRPVEYHGNGSATYTLRGAHVRYTVLWGYDADPGAGDSHEIVAQGTRSQVALQTVASTHGTQPEVTLTANNPADHLALAEEVGRCCEDWQSTYPGISVIDLGQQIQIAIPNSLRTDHEAHFAAVFDEFAGYFPNPRQIPPWERPNMLAKYYVTTKAVQMARQKSRNNGG